MLVPEANYVTQLMHHDAKLVAILSYRDGLGIRARFIKGFNDIIVASDLRSVTALANEGAAAARPLCEHDPVRVILRPLNELGE